MIESKGGWRLEGKNVVVLGVADRSSIGWSIAVAFAEQGARVHIGYQQRFFSRVRLLLREFPHVSGQRCDVLEEAEMAAFFSRFQEDPIDVLVHSIAHAAPEVFTEAPSDVSRQAFLDALEVSTVSLASVVHAAKPYLRQWASVVTLSFQASTRAVTLYGLMGVAKSGLESLVRYLALELGSARVRVNAISPGLVETPAALGEVLAYTRNPTAMGRLKGGTLSAMSTVHEAAGPMSDELDRATSAWRAIQAEVAAHSALPETISQQDVAGCALFLGSDLSRKITGQVIHVDAGVSASLIL